MNFPRQPSKFKKVNPRHHPYTKAISKISGITDMLDDLVLEEESVSRPSCQNIDEFEQKEEVLVIPEEGKEMKNVPRSSEFMSW